MSESPRRREVLEVLRDSGVPLGVSETATRMGVHPNTVRFHLDALVTEGTVERTLARPSGPGRPRAVHTVRRGMDRGGIRSYRLLARVLLSRLASSEADAAEEATEAGRVWGRYLIDEPAPSHRPSPDEAVQHLNALLADLGFDPQDPPADAAAPGPLRLRHCPFLELAEEYGPLVCPLHLGLMQGALTGLRAPVSATRLEPFAEPDACLAHLRPTTDFPALPPMP